MEVQRTSAKHLVGVHIGKVHPKSSVWSGERLYLGAARSLMVIAQCTLRADNLPGPVQTNFRFQIDAEIKKMDVTAVLLRTLQTSEDDEA